LCAQAIRGATFGIDEVMQLVLVGDALVPGNRGAVGCGPIEGDLRLAQCQISRAINGDFTAYSSRGNRRIHKEEYTVFGAISQAVPRSISAMRRCSFPPLGLKPRGFQLARFYERTVLFIAVALWRFARGILKPKT
ncbi:MAG: hypothetical protein ACJ8CR_37600, partial [Roseiflexaceae bacterium]